MSILSVSELVEGRNASVNGVGMTVDRTFHVHVDDSSHSAVYIYSQTIGLTIPGMRSQHPDMSSLVVTGIVFSPVDPVIWSVVVKYEPSTYGVISPTEDPWDEAPVVSFGSQSISQAFPFTYGRDFDQTRATKMTGANRSAPNVASRNFHGQPFDPLPEDDVALIVIRMTRNLKELNLDNYLLYRDTVNDTEIKMCGYTIKQFQGLLRTMDVDYRFTQSVPGSIFAPKVYPAITVEIVINPQTWFKQVVHSGKFKEGSLPGSFKLFKDEDGHSLPVDINMNAAGVPLATNANPIMVNFHTKWECSWEPLVQYKVIPEDSPAD